MNLTAIDLWLGKTLFLPPIIKFCQISGLANFKRPRRFVFVDAIPKSPVGKLLRRLLVAGEYDLERSPPSSAA